MTFAAHTTRVTESALPIVSAGEVRALNAALLEVSAGRAVVVMIDRVGVRHGQLNANQVREDLVLGAQMCLAIQLISGRRALLLMGLPNVHEADVEKYADYVAVSNLLKSYVSGGVVGIPPFASGDLGNEDPEGRWTHLRAELDQNLRFAHALGVSHASMAPFTHQVFLVHTSTNASAYLEAVLTRTDALLGDRVMCAGHLWWSDVPVESGALVSNPLGGRGHMSSPYADKSIRIRTVRPDETVPTLGGSASSALTLINVASEQDVSSLVAPVSAWQRGLAGLRVELSDAQSSVADHDLDYADEAILGAGLSAPFALLAAIRVGDHLADAG